MLLQKEGREYRNVGQGGGTRIFGQQVAVAGCQLVFYRLIP